jgi:hypothetical protein
MTNAGLGDVIGLMQRARTRYDWVELSADTYLRRDLFARAMHKQEAQASPGSVARLEPAEGWSAPPADAPVLVRQGRVHLWAHDLLRWRVDLELEEGYRQSEARNGMAFWRVVEATFDDDHAGPRLSVEEGPQYDPPQYMRLWDPALLVAELSLELGGSANVAGREGILLRARPRPTLRPDGQDFILLEEGGDRYELVIDAERGVVLRLIGELDGERMTVEEVIEVIFDRPPPDGHLEPPVEPPAVPN